MDFQTYQLKSRKTARYPDPGANLTYPTLGLTGEAGEVANKVKKVFRDNDGVVSDEVRSQLSSELGDVLWYVAQIATELNLNLNDIAEENINRLYSRMERGVLHGSGDTR